MADDIDTIICRHVYRGWEGLNVVLHAISAHQRSEVFWINDALQRKSVPASFWLISEKTFSKENQRLITLSASTELLRIYSPPSPHKNPVYTHENMSWLSISLICHIWHSQKSMKCSIENATNKKVYYSKVQNLTNQGRGWMN